MDKALGVLGVGAVEDDGSLGAYECGSPVVHVGRGVEPDAGVTMLVVVLMRVILSRACSGGVVFEAVE